MKTAKTYAHTTQPPPSVYPANLASRLNFSTSTANFLGATHLTYDARGTKLAQEAPGSLRRDYLSGIELADGAPESIYHPEGRALREGGQWKYEYVIRDHPRCLGKGPQTKATRVVFRPAPGEDTLTPLNTLAYYPFGMEIGGLSAGGAGYPYQYNGKELNAGVGWYDYGARWYDAGIGRWASVDPHAENYTSWSGYSYAYNNPLIFIDPTGMDNIIYLILIGGAGDKINAQELIQTTNQYLSDLGLDVTMQLFEHGSSDDFDPANLDPTDAFAVLGENPSQVADYIVEKTGFEGASLYGYRYNYENQRGKVTLEVNQGEGIALDEAQSQTARNAFEATAEEAAAFLTVHSYGHRIADLRHSGRENNDRGFMAPGSELITMGGIQNILNHPENSYPMSKITPKMYRKEYSGPFGNIPMLRKIKPKDNYVKNSKR